MAIDFGALWRKKRGGTFRGNIDGPKDDRTLSGWIAQMGNPEPRTFILKSDGVEVTRGRADRYRDDLRRAGVNGGHHSFSLLPPAQLLDSKPHRLKLIDAESGMVVARAVKRFGPALRFSDFDDWLRLSMVSPEIRAPFGEPAKRVFATMECIRKALCSEARKAEFQPLVSIVMPAFNRAYLIRLAIESVLAQTYSHFELVVVNDGSTDETADVVRTFNDPRVRLIDLAQNGGAAAARNVALDAANGDIIAYLDTDNTICEDFLLGIVGAFHMLPDADAIYCAQAVFDGPSLAPTMIRFATLNRSLLLNRNYIDLGAFAHRNSMLERTGAFDPKLKRTQDWDLIMRAVEMCRVVSVPAILSHYRMGLATNTITSDRKSADHIDLVRQRAFDRMIARAETPKLLSQPISVIIPNFEALDDLKQCLAALYRHDPAAVEVIIVDNHSSKPTREHLIEVQRSGRAKVVLNDVNFGFTHAVNQGIALAEPGRDVVLMNNDAIVTAGALGSMQEVALSDPAIAVVVPQQLLPRGAQSTSAHVPYALSAFPTDVNLSAHHENILRTPTFHDGGQLDLTFAPFFCAYLRRDALDQLGGLEAEHGRHYRSDRLYCNAVRHILGRRVVYTPDAVVHHKVQVATEQLKSARKDDYALMFQQNQWPADMAERLGFRPAVWDV